MSVDGTPVIRSDTPGEAAIAENHFRGSGDNAERPAVVTPAALENDVFAHEDWTG